ncbi:MAG: DNA polymerase III subunit delta [Muribaculaceae bacterium]|nr:DNA polymerase III subunit delta [Muribaculaceae bacterium]
MKFKEIPGNEICKQRLIDMVDNDRIPHALLLEGPEGIGKLAMARAMAQYIHCTNKQSGDSCGECAACRQHQALNHIDTFYVFPVVKLDKMNTPPISDDFLAEWKEFLADGMYADINKWATFFNKKNSHPVTYVTESASLLHKLSFTTHTSRYKVIVWWLPERMNEEASNKLLKMIEEPFPDTLFIMVSNNPKAILPTIYSRVQRIEMRRLSDADVAGILESTHSIDPTDAMSIAHISDGNMINAYANIQTDNDANEFFDFFVTLMRLAYQRKIKDLREWSSDLTALGRERELSFYEYAIRLIRENFIFNFNTPDLNYMNRKESGFSTNFARFITERNVEKLIEVFDKARIDIAGNANGKVVNLDVAIKVILLLKS